MWSAKTLCDPSPLNVALLHPEFCQAAGNNREHGEELANRTETYRDGNIYLRLVPLWCSKIAYAVRNKNSGILSRPPTGIHPCNNDTESLRILLILKSDGLFGTHSRRNPATFWDASGECT